MAVVDPGERVYVQADGDRRVTVVVVDGTVFYGDQDVDDQGTQLDAGESVTLDQGTWFFSSDGASFSTRDAADDLVVRDLSVTGTVSLGQAESVTEAVVAHDVNATFDDTEVEAALDALGTSVNEIRDALVAVGIVAE